MTHYVAELIHKIKEATSETEKKKLQKECCDMILKLWSKKENLPIRQPLQDLKPVIEVLEVLNEEKTISILPRWLENNSLPRENEWAGFIEFKNLIR